MKRLSGWTWMRTGEKEMVDEGLSMLIKNTKTGKARDISAVATPLKGVPARGQGTINIGR